MRRRRALAVLAVIAASVGCGERLILSDEVPDGGGLPGDASAGKDGGGGEDASADAHADKDTGIDGSSSCSLACGPGACVAGKCQEFVLVDSPGGAEIRGVAAANDRVFYTLVSLNKVGVRIGTAPPAVLLDGEDDPRAIHVVDGKLQWVNGIGLTVGLRESELDGGSRHLVPGGDFSAGCADIIFTAPNVFHYSLNGQPSIRKVEDGGAETIFASTLTPASHLAKASSTIVWMDVDKVVVGSLGPAGATLARAVDVGSTVTGVTISGTWVYFTTTKRDVGRVRTDGTSLQILRPGSPVQHKMGAITVTPNGKFAYWVQDSSVLGLAVSP